MNFLKTQFLSSQAPQLLFHFHNHLASCRRLLLSSEGGVWWVGGGGRRADWCSGGRGPEPPAACGLNSHKAPPGAEWYRLCLPRQEMQ